jgi:hypothetical protein
MTAISSRIDCATTALTINPKPNRNAAILILFTRRLSAPLRHCQTGIQTAKSQLSCAVPPTLRLPYLYGFVSQ